MQLVRLAFYSCPHWGYRLKREVINLQAERKQPGKNPVKHIRIIIRKGALGIAVSEAIKTWIKKSKKLVKKSEKERDSKTTTLKRAGRILLELAHACAII